MKLSLGFLLIIELEKYPNFLYLKHIKMSVELRNTSKKNDDYYDDGNMVTSVKYLSGTA